MKEIQILDWTLRDGGYVNNWDFGKDNIRNIINNLKESQIDIIECGFLTNKVENNLDNTRFNSIEQIDRFIPKNKGNSKYVCMINYGEYDIKDIPECKESSIDGIRLVFHKNQIKEAIEYSKLLYKKGYLLFIQPMVTISYTDMELLELINQVNEINPYALYIVDSFGVMRKNDLLRIFYLIDNNLNKGINVGYHSHNNLQLAYSNAQALVEVNTTRNLILDSSVFGMGRGAGNLNTELFVEYLNEILDNKYNVYPLLQIIDETLNNIYATNYWGYSLPHYLSSTVNCHPNYATYLSDKNNLSIKSISDILSKITDDKKSKYDLNYIEKLYKDHQKHDIDDKQNMEKLKCKLEHKNILVIAPGKTIDKYKDEINKINEQKDIITISVNFIPETWNVNHVFIGNEKRFDKLYFNHDIDKVKEKLIITSNIDIKDKDILKLNYINLINDTQEVSDNSTLMLLKLLTILDVNKIFIAGFDGYSYDNAENYADKNMILNNNNSTIKELNNGIEKELISLSTYSNIEFVTPTKYKKIINL